MKAYFLRSLVFGVLFVAGGLLRGAEIIPPAPARHFNDYAGVVRRETAEKLDRQLEQFERDTSTQLLVAIFPTMQSDSSVQDYTVRVAEAWKVGQKTRDNGAVLFAFMAERELFLQVGYGLEGAIPDVVAKRIIEREIVPRFRARDFDGGMIAAVNAMTAAARGEYRGTGRTRADDRRQTGAPSGSTALILGVMLLIFVINLVRAGRRSSATVFNNPRRRSVLHSPSWWMTGGGGGGRSSWGGGGGGGGFSGGGGSFGGGGAGGRW